MYNKGLSWYISKEVKKVAVKIENKINSKNIPKVSVRTEVKGEQVQIIIDAPDYAKYQDKGVAGVDSGRSLAGYKYKNKMPPPDAFSRYTSDKSGQFAIAKSIYNKGIPAKKYIDTTIGHYAPQVKKAIDRGVRNYTDIKLKENGNSI